MRRKQNEEEYAVYWYHLFFGRYCFLVLGIRFAASDFSSVLFGFTGAGVASGIAMIYRYFYWNRPDKRDEYSERLENERINMKDERKVMLRARSGQICYQVNLLILIVMVIISSVLMVDSYVIIMLSFLFIFQYILGLVVFKQISKKY